MRPEKKETNPEKRIFTVPNIISMVRIGLIPLIVWLYLNAHYFWAGTFVIVSSLTDIVDGKIARHFNLITDLGKVLDPIADKLTQGVVFLCLMSRYWWLIFPFVLMAVKEVYMAVSGLVVVKKAKFVPGAQWHGKLATVVVCAAMMLHLFWFTIPPVCSYVLSGLCAVAILLSLVLYIIRNTRLILRAKGDASL